MPSWGLAIIIGSLMLGLKRPANASYRYAAMAVLVIAAVLYAAVRQHTY